MPESKLRVAALSATLAAVLLRVALEGLFDDGSTGLAAGTLALLVASLVLPLAAYIVLAGPMHGRPRRLRAGDAPGTLVAPARQLAPGCQLIGGGWLATNALAHPGVGFGPTFLGVALLVVGVVGFARPRPRLVLDAEGVTLHLYPLGRPRRVLWREVRPATPVLPIRSVNGKVAGLELVPVTGHPVGVPSGILDVEPEHLGRVLADLAAAADRREFIDSYRSAV